MSTKNKVAENWGETKICGVGSFQGHDPDPALDDTDPPPHSKIRWDATGFHLM